MSLAPGAILPLDRRSACRRLLRHPLAAASGLGPEQVPGAGLSGDAAAATALTSPEPVQTFGGTFRE